ncbi:Bifunctional inhibitor/lipid-transfer protein/seed storage 2S albumin superfamily protein [Trifolium repens]|nr:Bifunctional inhibitor/lipid-transfer protein/seed storage 2S albumin superfamily protein [Trifolium repens]
MATTTLVVTIVSLLFASTLTCHGVSAANVAQSPAPVTADAPVPAPDVCFTAITNMSDCLTFVEDGSKLTKPDKGCCPELAGLVDGNPACLCHLLGNSESIIGIKINVNKALKLPTLCKVTTPDISLCSAIGYPVSLPPSLSPSLSPSSSASLPPSSSGDSMSPGMSMTPTGSAESSIGGISPTGSKSGASSIQAFSLTFIFALSTLSISIFF